jgi:hypothetical protein
MESDTYTDLLNRGHALLQQKNLPEKFVRIGNLILESHPEEDVSDLFMDINEQIEAYKQQFAIIVQELGVIAPMPIRKNELASLFFLRLLDLFKLARRQANENNTRLQIYQDLLQKYVDFLEAEQGTIEFETQRERSLFEKLGLSAFASAKKMKNTDEPEIRNELRKTTTLVEKQEGGRLKRKTRKHKRKAQ